MWDIVKAHAISIQNYALKSKLHWAQVPLDQTAYFTGLAELAVWTATLPEAFLAASIGKEISFSLGGAVASPKYFSLPNYFKKDVCMVTDSDIFSISFS